MDDRQVQQTSLRFGCGGPETRNALRKVGKEKTHEEKQKIIIAGTRNNAWHVQMPEDHNASVVWFYFTTPRGLPRAVQL